MTTQLKFLMKLFIFHGTFAFVFWICTMASASVIDAPHNETNDIKCGHCHAYSVWWQYSPAANNDGTPYAQITDGVCNKCHAPGGSAPNKISHSWGSMLDIHDTYLGVWETKCLDCHNPHYQDQLNWQGTNGADLFLVSGTIAAGSIQVNPGTNTTTLDYKNADAHANWTDPALWSKKSNDGRGLILVISDTAQNTFEISSATQLVGIVPGSANGTGTITLQGSLPTSYNAADTNFAVIYGQLIKKSIATPTSGAKDVKFFDASLTYASDTIGGTADMTADPIANPPQGICQVCHTKTKYYNNDGKQPDRANPAGPRVAALAHNSTSPCTGCHAISVGFRPTNADHTFISNLGTTCANCHNQADIVTGTHKGNCTDCHTAPPALVTPFPTTKWPTATGQPRATGTCVDCHTPIATTFTAHPKALDHSGQVDPYTNASGVTTCTGCHFHRNKDVINDIHGVDGSPCDTCHELAYNAGSGTYSGSGVLISRAAQYGKGNCKKCHPDIAGNFFVHPNSGDHTGQVDATPQCLTCHDWNHADPEIVDPTVSIIHLGNCGLCHNSLNGYQLKGVAENKGPGTCMNCHTDFFVHTNTNAQNHSIEVKVPDFVNEPLTQKNCMECHNSSDLITGLHVTCSTCHDQYGALVGSAAGHAGGGTCRVCHLSKDTEAHPSINHTQMTPYVVSNAEGNCVSCHIGDPVADIHNSNCTGCHTGLSTIPDPITGIAPINVLKGSAAGHAGHNQNTCTDCHDQIGAGFPNHANYYVKHFSYIKTYDINCSTCHPGSDPIWNIHKMDCSNCHLEDGRLTGSATGKGTGKTRPTQINCIDCHSGAQYNNAPVPPSTLHPLP